MEIFQGDLHSPEFRPWFERATKGLQKTTIVAASYMHCSDAKKIIDGIPVGSLNQKPWLSDDIKKAMFHLITCQQIGCRGLLYRLVQKDS